jgi:hypothetical protein
MDDQEMLRKSSRIASKEKEKEDLRQAKTTEPPASSGYIIPPNRDPWTTNELMHLRLAFEEWNGSPILNVRMELWKVRAIGRLLVEINVCKQSIQKCRRADID